MAVAVKRLAAAAIAALALTAGVAHAAPPQPVYVGASHTTGKLTKWDGPQALTDAVAGTDYGSVSSVGLSLPGELTCSGSPITTSGTFSCSWTSQSANKVFASPNGSSGAPGFRALVAADLPTVPLGGLAAIGAGDFLCNSTSGSAAPADNGVSACFDRAVGSAVGDLVYRRYDAWRALAAGSQGQVLTIGSTTAVTPSFVSKGTIANIGNVTSSTVAYPATTFNGDVAFLTMTFENASGCNPAMATPSGWTLLASDGSSGVWKYLYTKALNGTEGGSSVTLATTNGSCSSTGAIAGAWSAVVSEWTGVNSAGTYYEGLNITAAASSTIAGHSITTTGPNELAVHLVTGMAGGSLSGCPCTIAVPSGWTGAFDNPLNAIDGSHGSTDHHADYKTVASAGTVTAPSSASSPVSYWYASFDFALIPYTIDLNWLAPAAVPCGNLPSLTGDATSSGCAVTVSKTAGVAFGAFATGTNAANLTGNVPAAQMASNLTGAIDSMCSSPAQGAIVYRDASLWKCLAPATAGWSLTTGGAGANPSWANVGGGGGGGVTSVATNAPWTSGGTITTTGTIDAGKLVKAAVSANLMSNFGGL